MNNLFAIHWQVCVTKLELETLEQGLILEIIFASGQILIALLINKIGKFPIVCKCYEIFN